MIIKSMSRKHPSFAQLIDYIEGESKLRSRRYSVFHNTYSRSSDRLKAEFMENSEHLRYRKNGVFLYHEVISITRTQQIDEDQQKAALKQIVEEYLSHRGKHNLAYAVLHEDTEHLHFHIVMSANEAGERERVRLSKEKFAGIQTSLEAWVLEKHPKLEQRAVFYENQTAEERQQRQEKKDRAHAHLSDKGEQMKRRGAKTDRRDTVQEELADIFTTATDPRQFTELLEKAGFKLYQRGQQHGVIDQDGKKYRLNRLGLGEAWDKLEAKMMERLQGDTQTQTQTVKPEQAHRSDQASTDNRNKAHQPPPETKTTQETEVAKEAERRLDEIRRMRQGKAEREERQDSNRNQDRDR